MKATMLTKVRAYLARRRALGFQLKCEGFNFRTSLVTPTGSVIEVH